MTKRRLGARPRRQLAVYFLTLRNSCSTCISPQVSDVPAWALGTLIRLARASLPEGCALSVHDHAVEHEEVRYVPDNQLIDLKQQLEDMGGARPDKKKRK